MASLDTLLATKDEPEVCQTLLEMLEKDVKRKNGWEPTYPLFRVLLASDLPDAEDGLLSLFNKMSTTSADNAVLLMSSLADAMAKKGEPTELPQLLRLTKTNAFKDEFGLRRAMVQAAMHYPSKEAVAFVFEVYAEEKGELRGDIVEYLTQVTQQKFGNDAQAWLKWWQANEKTFEYPAGVKPQLLRTLAVQGMGSYYGIPLYAQRMVFVLDTSGSMRGPRIEAAKRDLTSTVNGSGRERLFQHGGIQ